MAGFQAGFEEGSLVELGVVGGDVERIDALGPACGGGSRRGRGRRL